MARIDELLPGELERLVDLPDPRGVTEGVLRRAGRKRALRRVGSFGLALAVLIGTLAGVYGLQRVFRGGRTEHAPAGTSAIGNGLIAFASPPGGRGQHLYVVNPDGTGLRQLTHGPDTVDSWPAWSPDGSEVAFVRRDELERTIRLTVVDVATGDVRTLTPPEMSVARPDWSPDASRIAFAGFGEGAPSGIYLVNADGSDLHRITDDRFFAPDNPEWSPDGSTIAFTANLDESIHSWDVYLIAPDGSDLRNVTDTPDEASSELLIGWLPGRDALLLSRGPGSIATGPDLPEQRFTWLLVTPDGREIREVLSGTYGPEGYQGAAISPDGRLAVFNAALDGRQNVWIIDLETLQLSRVTSEGGFHSAWQPVPEVAASPGPVSPTPEPVPTAGRDLGLGFSLCNLESLGGIDLLGDGSAGRAWVGTRVGGNGACPSIFDGPNLVLADVDGDGVADASYELGGKWSQPFNCIGGCRPYAAIDLDRNGAEELVVLLQPGTVSQHALFVGGRSPTGVVEIAPVIVAPPGDDAGGFPAREPVSLWAGGDEGSTAAVVCTETDGVLTVVATSGYHPVEGSGADVRHVHEARMVLEAGMMNVVGTQEWTEPTSSDPSWWPGGKSCGVDFDSYR